MTGMITVYGMKASGNCYKVQLLLEQLERPYHWVEVNSVAGETRTAEFLAKNSNGKVPLLELADGRILAESNAILFYLSEATQLLPEDRWLRGQTLQWLFFEQYSHEPYIAVARFIMRWLAPDHPRRAELPRLLERGNLALEVMEKHLQKNDFFVDSSYGIADIALYAYTHEASSGGFILGNYPAIQSWLARVESQPGFIAQSY
jgi:glutathione S-transferase